MAFTLGGYRVDLLGRWIRWDVVRSKAGNPRCVSVRKKIQCVSDQGDRAIHNPLLQIARVWIAFAAYILSKVDYFVAPKIMYASSQISFLIISKAFVECDEKCEPSWYPDIHDFVGTIGAFKKSGQDLYAATAGHAINNSPTLLPYGSNSGRQPRV